MLVEKGERSGSSGKRFTYNSWQREAERAVAFVIWSVSVIIVEVKERKM